MIRTFGHSLKSSILKGKSNKKMQDSSLRILFRYWLSVVLHSTYYFSISGSLKPRKQSAIRMPSCRLVTVLATALE